MFLDTDLLYRIVLKRAIGLYNPYPAHAVDLFHGNPLVPPPPEIRSMLAHIAGQITLSEDDKNGLPLHPYRQPEIITTALDAAAVRDLSRDGVLRQAGAREVVCGAGVTQLMIGLLHALGTKGGTVLFPTPTYTYPILAGKQVGANMLFLEPTAADRGYEIDVERIGVALSSRPDISSVLLVNPLNPTGEVLSKAKITRLVAILRDFPDILIIVDEIYRRMILDGSTFVAIAAALPERTITLRGLSKCYGLASLRVGYAAAPADVFERVPLRSFIWFNTAAPSDLCQWVAAEVLQRTTAAYHHRVVTCYQGLLDVAVGRLARMRARTGIDVQVVRPASGSFLLFRIPELRDCVVRGTGRLCNDADLCLALLNRGVAMMPGSVFGIPETDMTLRLTFTSPKSDILTGLDGLEGLIVDILAEHS